MYRRKTVIIFISSLLSVPLAGCLDPITENAFGNGGDLNDRQRTIVTSYDDAMQERNDAIPIRDEGIEAFNAEGYDRAIDAFETAREGLESAEEAFTEATEIAVEIGADSAVAICETAAEETQLQIDATAAALNAANAAADGEPAGTINDYILEFQELEAEAAELVVEDTDALVTALGLD